MARGNEAAQDSCLFRDPGTEQPPAAGQELAQGLMLLRASTMKMVRLQLAIERRDRRVALEALDELVTLDGRIRDLVTDLPADGSDPPMHRRLEEERSVLVRERLTLAAGIMGPAIGRDRPRWIDPEPSPSEDGEADPDAGGDHAASPRRRPALAIVLVLLLLALLAAGAAALIGTPAGRGVLAAFLSSMESL